MRLGVLIPTRGVVMQSARRPAVEECWAMAREADRAGLDAVWIGDSVVWKPRLEPLTTLAYLAAITSRVRLGTAVLLPALRQPVVLAQLIANVDQISRGRLVLGLGVGWSLSGLSSITSCRRSPALDEAYGATYPDRLCLDGARLVEVSRSIPLPPWAAESSYDVGAVVQFAGDAYRALVPIQPYSHNISDASVWTKLGPTTDTAEYRTETDSYRKVIANWRTGSLEVYEPDGTILKYASRAGSNASVGGSAQVCTWGKPHLDQSGRPVPHAFDDVTWWLFEKS